jgi:hypothetical protein
MLFSDPPGAWPIAPITGGIVFLANLTSTFVATRDDKKPAEIVRET